MSTKIIILLLCVLELTACATPAEHFAEVAKRSGFYGFTLNSGTFSHQFYSNTRPNPKLTGEVLHVYLDGDGSPWKQHRWVNDDPTSRNPMILELMQQDKSTSVFLGRPCYHGFSHSSTCHYKHWTSHRYSNEVVNSMAQALQLWLKKNSFKHLVLIGYSGGGTLAVLMAPHITNVQTVVTLAANLDVEAWSRYHGYNPLTESLNPATFSALNPQIKQIHLSGLKDTNVPAQIIESYADRQANALYLAYADYDHHCCWTRVWKSILSKF